MFEEHFVSSAASIDKKPPYSIYATMPGDQILATGICWGENFNTKAEIYGIVDDRVYFCVSYRDWKCWAYAYVTEQTLPQMNKRYFVLDSKRGLCKALRWCLDHIRVWDDRFPDEISIHVAVNAALEKV